MGTRFTLYEGDCLDIMPTLPASSVDLILCDLPYGTTQNKWDSVLPLDRLWECYWRLSQTAVLTAACPFDKVLAMSALAEFKYQWIWEKTAATGFLNAAKAPLRAHEVVLVFSTGVPLYVPQKTQGHLIKRVNASYACHGASYNKASSVRAPYESTERYPRDVLLFAKDNRMGRPHPTQKPVALMEYLIRTYTNPGDLVLDNCMGSGTTGVACANTGRRFIGIERDAGYFAATSERIERAFAESVL